MLACCRGAPMSAATIVSARALGQPAAARAGLVSWPCDNLDSRAIDAVSWQRRCAPFTAAVHVDALSPTNHNTNNCRQAWKLHGAVDKQEFLAKTFIPTFPWSPVQQCQRPLTTCRSCDSSRSSKHASKTAFSCMDNTLQLASNHIIVTIDTHTQTPHSQGPKIRLP